MQGLVEGAAVGVHSVGQDVDRDAVQCECDEDASLMRRQHFRDRALERCYQLALLGLSVRLEAGAPEQVPAMVLERQLASLPGPRPELDPRLEQRKLVDPGG